MREFKFIRDNYTDENIFNTDETSACLFAYDNTGLLVDFTVQNNENFQKKFVELSSDRLSEIYTLRPSQFTISAHQKGSEDFTYNFTANTKVYDGSREFPEKVVKNAEEKMKVNTSAAFGTTSGLPVLNLTGEKEKITKTTFTFNNDKTFTRNLVFKVSGYLNERGYVTAYGESIEAYSIDNDDIINYDGEATRGTFYGGRLQTSVDAVEKNIISGIVTVNESNISELNVASGYTPASGYKFIYGNKIADALNYADNLEFYLYKAITSYLVAAESKDAVSVITEDEVTTYTLNAGYVAYAKDTELTKIQILDSDSGDTYEDATGNISIIDSTDNYDFYKKFENVTVYKYIALSKIADLGDNEIVKSYAESYSGLCILDSGSLREIEEKDLTGSSISVYPSSDNYHIFNNHVYNDSEDETKYAMFNGDWKNSVAIDSSNTYINSNNIPSPIITNNTLRLITEVDVNATQSD